MIETMARKISRILDTHGFLESDKQYLASLNVACEIIKDAHQYDLIDYINAGWKPIAECPKDGSKFDVMQTSGDRLIECEWCPRMKCVILKHGYPQITTLVRATHFRLPPEKPLGVYNAGQ